jgi:hypothetical protein
MTVWLVLGIQGNLIMFLEVFSNVTLKMVLEDLGHIFFCEAKCFHDIHVIRIRILESGP